MHLACEGGVELGPGLVGPTSCSAEAGGEAEAAQTSAAGTVAPPIRT